MLTATCGLLLIAGGCSRTIKESIGLATGAKGLHAPVDDVSASKIAEYRNFKLGDFADGTGGVAPRALWTHLGPAFAEALERAKLPTDPDGPTLIARGTVIYYEDSDLMDQAFGPFEEVVARVNLVDAKTGEVLGEANCVGRSSTTTTMGIRKKAQGLAAGIVKWIAEKYPDGAEQ